MTNLRQAAQQALEALEISQDYVEASANSKLAAGWGEQLDRADKAITALRTALEQQAEPVHGDIRALKYRIHELEGEVMGYKRMLDVAEAASQPQQQAEPVAHFGSAYINENGVHITTVLGPVAIPQDAKLYTAPPQQQAEPVQKPKYMAQSNGRHSPLLTHMMNKRTALAEPEQSFEDEQRVINADNHRRANALEEAIHAAWSAGYVEGEKAVLEQQAEPVSELQRRYLESEKAFQQQAEPVEPKCGAIIEVFGKDWRLEYLSLPVGKHKLYVQQYTYTAPPQRKPLPKGEWPKHKSPYVKDEYIGYAKSDLDDYAMQVLAAHNIKEQP